MQLPGAFRRLPRPSSVLKPSHSPDGVACRAYLVVLVFVWCVVCLGFLRGVHCELVYVFAHFSLHHQSFRVDDCICFEVFLDVEFDLKGTFALLLLVFVSYKSSVLCGVVVTLCFVCCFCVFLKS